MLIMLRMLVLFKFFHGSCDDTLPKFVLMKFSSFAIWDKNKVVMALTSTLWVANVSYQLAGEFTFPIPCEPQ